LSFQLPTYRKNSTPHRYIPSNSNGFTFAMRPLTKIAGAKRSSAAYGTAIFS